MQTETTTTPLTIVWVRPFPKHGDHTEPRWYKFDTTTPTYTTNADYVTIVIDPTGPTDSPRWVKSPARHVACLVENGCTFTVRPKHPGEH